MKKLLLTALAFASFFVSAQTQVEVGINFFWSAAECSGTCLTIDGYRIYRVGGGVVVETDETATDVTVNQFALVLDEETCFEIVAFNSGGESGRSAPVCDTPTQTPPGTPQFLDINFTAPLIVP